MRTFIASLAIVVLFGLSSTAAELDCLDCHIDHKIIYPSQGKVCSDCHSREDIPAMLREHSWLYALPPIEPGNQ